MVLDAIKRSYTNTIRSAAASSGAVPLTDVDEQGVVSYAGVVSVGTPAQALNVIIDTGSSGLSLATTPCTGCPSGIPLFDPSKSSTYRNVSTTGSPGSNSSVSGILEDTVTFGAFAVQNLQFAPLDPLLVSTIDYGSSGSMGLGFRNVSASEPEPFWRVLYDQKLISQPVFGVYLERHVNPSNQTSTAPGGTLTLGGTNASLYTGNIEFTNMPNGTASLFWSQQVQSITVQGTSISIPSSMGVALIDTGVSFISAPGSIVQEIWAQVPGSVPLTDKYQGLYGFPCSTNVSVSISFGGTHWTIDPADMNLGIVEGSSNATDMCIGAIYGLSSFNASEPSWVIGDAFLKNVYVVFQADPPAIGFAQLSSLGGTSTSGAVGDPTFSVSLGLVVILLAWFSI